ncbi:hypothetical protein V6N11_054404 [Hibiscus sabdariffa]|uniref:Uncharacterized protein n=1 Tax=Hibiscus sabdariffa TaxID=183260 RepID=A0ABR2S4C4_9ROSI
MIHVAGSQPRPGCQWGPPPPCYFSKPLSGSLFAFGDRQQRRVISQTALHLQIAIPCRAAFNVHTYFFLSDVAASPLMFRHVET